MPMRIQRKRVKGWRLPSKTVCISRPSRWGNPYQVYVFGIDLALELFERSVKGIWDPTGIPDALISDAYAAHRRLTSDFATEHPTEAAIRELRGKDLACWCKVTERCHGDVLLKLANPETVIP